MNNSNRIEEKILKVKESITEKYSSAKVWSGDRKVESLVKAYLSDVDEEAISREEYYKILVKKDEELEHMIFLLNSTCSEQVNKIKSRVTGGKRYGRSTN